MKKNEFLYCFQIDRRVIFNVEFYTSGDNEKPRFSLSAAVFNRPKTCYEKIGQCQEEVTKGLAKEFVKKWNNLHLHFLFQHEYMEICRDIEKLKNEYNYIEVIDEEGFRNERSDIPFYKKKELSMMEIKKNFGIKHYT